MAQTQPEAFHHRGMHLRHAVERDLFFRLANNDQLQARFDARLERQSLPAAPADPWCAVIEPYLDRTADLPPSPAVPRLDTMRRCRTRLGNLLRFGKPAFVTRSSAADILFLCIHPKFVDYFRPVAEATGLGAVFLTINNVLLEAHLAARGLEAVGLRPIYSPLPRDLVMRHFPYLCGVLDSLCAMMAVLRPRMIVVPEGNAPVYELALLAGQPLGVSTICVQHGAPAYSNPGFRNWHFDDVLVWGDAFIEPFVRHNPGQRFTVAGTPALLPSAADAEKPIRSVGFFLQKGATVIPEGEWQPLLDFIAWTAQTFPHLEVIVRDHPSQPHLASDERAKLDGLPNIRFMPPPSFSLNDALTASDVVAATASTTLLEAVQCGAVPFIFGTAYPRDFPDIVQSGAGVSAPGLSQAKVLMARLAIDAVWQSTLRRRDGNCDPICSRPPAQKAPPVSPPVCGRAESDQDPRAIRPMRPITRRGKVRLGARLNILLACEISRSTSPLFAIACASG
jgi:hypothetical protein